MNHKVHLAQSAEAMLLAREHNFPIIIADMYDRDTLSESLCERRFKNDTVGEAFPEGKRLEKLFDLYTKMTAK